jgi:hypothetical protein
MRKNTNVKNKGYYKFWWNSSSYEVFILEDYAFPISSKNSFH